MTDCPMVAASPEPPSRCQQAWLSSQPLASSSAYINKLHIPSIYQEIDDRCLAITHCRYGPHSTLAPVDTMWGQLSTSPQSYPSSLYYSKSHHGYSAFTGLCWESHPIMLSLAALQLPPIRVACRSVACRCIHGCMMSWCRCLLLWLQSHPPSSVFACSPSR